MTVDIFGQKLYKDHAHDHAYYYTTLILTADEIIRINNNGIFHLFKTMYAYNVKYESAQISHVQVLTTTFEAKKKQYIQHEDPSFIKISIRGVIYNIKDVLGIVLEKGDEILFSTKDPLDRNLYVEFLLKIPIVGY